MADEEYAIQRLHLTMHGDPALAGRWLPYAKAMLRGLLRAQAAFGADQVKKESPALGIEITARVTGDQRFIHIKAAPGCSDRRGFLLDRRSGSSYDALYNDGLVENINPITGSPRPDPDTAVRTKGYKVVEQLQMEGLDKLTASKFSGIMRLVVGCYHAGGKEAPFSYNHAITHGIVKMAAVVNNKETTLYWLVEVSRDGVYAAPVANTGKCCDSWNVSAYQNHPPIPGTPVSLYSSFNLARPRVRVLVSSSEMATGPYAADGPFFAGSGWAFSASGAEAQQVVQTLLTSPAKHYVCSRWKLAFGLDGSNNLVGALTEVEGGRNATMRVNSVVWAPSGGATWEGAWGAGLESPNPIVTYPSQDAPIFVYYSGEEAQVVRWTLTRTSVPRQFTDEPFEVYVCDGVTVEIYSCPFGTTLPFLDDERAKPNVGGYDYNAHTNISFGFVCAGRFNHVADSYSKNGSLYSLRSTVIAPDIQDFLDNYDLDPDCYYINAAGSLVTNCTSGIHEVVERAEVSVDRTIADFAQAHFSSLVLFAEEREAVLAVRRDQTSTNGELRRDYGSVLTNTKRTRSKTSIPGDNPECPWVTLESGQCGTGPPIFPVVTTPIDEAAQTGSAVMLIDNLDVAAVLGYGPAPTFDPVNFNLDTFLIWSPSRTAANSNVTAMHGNLHYSDVKLVPPDQRANSVYLLDNTLVVTGGFATPVAAVAFVGKA